MWRSSIEIAILSLAACAHEPAATQRAAPASQGSVVPVHSQATNPVAGATNTSSSDAAKGSGGDTAKASSTDTAKASSGNAPKSAVNKDLLKQGYTTATRNGQLVYCRARQMTGTRFKTQMCLREDQILDEQKRAKDTLTAPRQSLCVGPQCAG